MPYIPYTIVDRSADIKAIERSVKNKLYGHGWRKRMNTGTIWVCTYERSMCRDV
jgi:hypothetical protein